LLAHPWRFIGELRADTYGLAKVARACSDQSALWARRFPKSNAGQLNVEAVMLGAPWVPLAQQ